MVTRTTNNSVSVLRFYLAVGGVVARSFMCLLGTGVGLCVADEDVSI
jgi:hypothetical protein